MVSVDPLYECTGDANARRIDETFEDYEAGRGAGRYLSSGLPALPLEDRSFDLALASHFLFPFSAHLSEEFHVLGVLELLRVANEAMIFPIVTLDAEPSPYLEAVKRAVAAAGCECEERMVPYEVQKGADRMLVARRYES